jgi:hypothetical protein
MSVILHSGGYDSKVSSLSRAWAAEQDPVSQKVEKKEGRKKAKGKEAKRSEGEGREKERKKGREGKGRKKIEDISKYKLIKISVVQTGKISLKYIVTSYFLTHFNASIIFLIL